MADDAARKDARITGPRAAIATAVAIALAAAVGRAPAAPAAHVVPPPGYLDAGHDAAGNYAIVADSVRRRGGVAEYDLMMPGPRPGASEPRRILVDCRRRLRAVVPASAPAAPASYPASRVRAGSREAAETAVGCELPSGPARLQFTGLIVSEDGAVVAPHVRTDACPRIVAWAGSRRRVARLVANAGDIALLRIDGGPYRPMPGGTYVDDHIPQQVTMLAMTGLVPRISAGAALRVGSNPSDEGWPQVKALVHRAVPEGPVWSGNGDLVGFGVSESGRDARYAMTRLLPTSTLRKALAPYGVEVREASGTIAPEAALRAALAATVPLACEMENGDTWPGPGAPHR